MSDASDFDRLLDASFERLKRSFSPGEKVKGRIVAITGNAVLVDIQAKSEGVIDVGEFMEKGEVTVKEGDEVEAYYIGQDDGEIRLTVSMSAREVDDADVVQAYMSQIPIQGKVTGANKGGLEVAIGGLRGFCPVSQIDTVHVEDPAVLVGNVLTFKVLEYEGGNLVLSRRRYLEEQQAGEKAKLKERLQEGDIVSGRVARVVDFGVFVSLGGVDGLIPMGELAWDRVQDANTIVSAGDTITVKVLAIDWNRDRVTLSLKQAGADPWADVVEQFVVGTPYRGTVTKLMEFGAFVRLAPGVEGLVHISKLGAGKRLKHPSEVVHEGQELEVYVDEVDMERKRLSLSLENAQTGRTMEVEGRDITVGATLEGKVDGIKPYGIFVRLGGRQSGLLHISEIQAADARATTGNLQRSYEQGQAITVVVKAVHDGKISLGLPRAAGSTDEAAEDFRADLTSGDEGGRSGFGSLGDAFDKLNL